MIGRRAIVGLSLLSALLFWAMAAQSASATAHTSENTTAFTCVKVKAETGEFADPHCDTTKAGGEYAHELIPSGSTEIEISNEKTANKTTEVESATLLYTQALKTHFECKTVSGTGTIENAGTGSEHKVSGVLGIQLTNCTVKTPANCKLKEPVVMEATFKGVDELNGAEKNMGLEFASKGANFTEITFEGEKCAIKGKIFPITGTMIATGGNTEGGPSPSAKESGATWSFANEKEMESLKLGSETCTFNATFTTRMKGGGNPIALTTTT